MTIIREKYGKIDLLQKEILSLKAKIKSRDKTIEKLKMNKSLEEFKDEIRIICKNPKLICCNVCCEKINKIYIKL